MVQNMENEFFKIHGKDFIKQPNIRLNLISEIKQKYPEIPHDMVNLFARSRIYFRCNYLNKVAQDKAIKERIEKRKLKAKAIEEAKMKEIAVATMIDKEKNVSTLLPPKKTPLSANIIRTSRKRKANFPTNETDDRSTTQKRKKENVEIEHQKTGSSIRTRNLKRSVNLLYTEAIDCSDDIERKKTQKVKKFLT